MTLVAHSGPVYAVSLSPDRRGLLSASEDSTGTVVCCVISHHVVGVFDPMYLRYSLLLCSSIVELQRWCKHCCVQGMLQAHLTQTLNSWFLFCPSLRTRALSHCLATRVMLGRCGTFASPLSATTLHPHLLIALLVSGALIMCSLCVFLRVMFPMWMYVRPSYSFALSILCLLIVLIIVLSLVYFSALQCVQFHPNSNYVATGSSDRTIRVWDIQSGACVRLMLGHSGPVHGVAFSPDGKSLASCGASFLARSYPYAHPVCVRMW